MSKMKKKHIMILIPIFIFFSCVTTNDSNLKTFDSIEKLLQDTKKALSEKQKNISIDQENINTKRTSLLKTYNFSCQLGLAIDTILLQSFTFSLTLPNQTSHEMDGVVNVEVCEFINPKKSKEIYDKIFPKTIELRNIKRESLFNFCIWQQELFISHIYIKDKYLLLINEQGYDFPIFYDDIAASISSSFFTAVNKKNEN